MRINNLPALDTDYGEAEARLALATADAFVLEGLGSGGSGSGGTATSPTTIAQGIDLSADIGSLLQVITEIDSELGANTDLASATGTFSAKLRIIADRLATVISTLANQSSQGPKATANATAVSPATDSAPFPTDALTDLQLRASPVAISHLPANLAEGIDDSQNLQAVLADVADLLTSLGNTTTTLPGGIANTNLHGKLMVVHKSITDILSMLNSSALGGVGSLQVVPAAGSTFTTTALTNAQLRSAPVEMTPAGGSIFTTNSLTDAQLRAVPVQTTPGAGAVFNTNALTDTQLRATAVSVKPESGTEFITNALTDAQLRATAVPVSHNGLTDEQLRATPVAVAWQGAMNVSTDGLTNSQLRASPVPVSHDGLTDAQLRASALSVIGPLTNAQLRATPVSVSVSGMGPTALASAFSVTSASASQMVSAFGANSKVFSLVVQNLGSNTAFLQLHSSSPDEGAVPILSIRMVSGSTLMLGDDFFGPVGVIAVTGSVWAGMSSTNATWTGLSNEYNITIGFIA